MGRRCTNADRAQSTQAGRVWLVTWKRGEAGRPPGDDDERVLAVFRWSGASRTIERLVAAVWLAQAPLTLAERSKAGTELDFNHLECLREDSLHFYFPASKAPKVYARVVENFRIESTVHADMLHWDETAIYLHSSNGPIWRPRSVGRIYRQIHSSDPQ
jgi:hypothetical protein